MAVGVTCDGVELAVECNPNIFPDAFKAEVFIQLKSETMEVSTQCLLPKLVEGVKAYKASLPE